MPKPRHMVVGYSSSRQEVTLLRDSRQTHSSRQTDRQTEERLPNILSPPAADSSHPRQIAAATPPKVVMPSRTAAATPPKVITAPSNLFDSNKPAENIFISPHIPKQKKWDLIKNGKLHTPVDNEDFTHMIPGGLTKLLKRQGEQNDRIIFNLLAGQAKKQKLRRPHVHVSVPWGSLPRQQTGTKRTRTSSARSTFQTFLERRTSTSPTGTRGRRSSTPTAIILSRRQAMTTTR
jgi:hypothetical protein